MVGHGTDLLQHCGRVYLDAAGGGYGLLLRVLVAASVDSVVVPHLCAAIEAFSPHYGTHQHSGPPYRSPSKLSKLDLEDEEAEAFGVGKIEDFTQKQMLDFYACVECGRCTNVCPASNTGKLLSPMHMIVKLRDHLTEKGLRSPPNRHGCQPLCLDRRAFTHGRNGSGPCRLEGRGNHRYWPDDGGAEALLASG